MIVLAGGDLVLPTSFSPRFDLIAARGSEPSGEVTRRVHGATVFEVLMLRRAGLIDVHVHGVDGATRWTKGFTSRRSRRAALTG